jgi:hypothetical protein
MRYACVAFVIAACLSVKAVCLAQPVSSSELISRAKIFDNTTITYSGEAVGDVMKRSDGAWVNVNDGANAIGVWMPADMAGRISVGGDFKHGGDMIEFTGTFHRACDQHGGDLDIHAQAMQVLRPGGPVPCGISKTKKDWAVKLLGVAAIIWILSLLKTR